MQQRELRVGDVVRIRSHAELWQCTNIVDSMLDYAGMEATVTRVDPIPDSVQRNWNNTKFYHRLKDIPFNWHEDSLILLPDEPGEVFRC